MHKIVFANGQELAARWFEESAEFYDNAQRRVLIVRVPKDAMGLDALDALLSDSENVAKIKNTHEESGAEGVYDHYEIKMELAVRAMPVGVDEDGAETTEEQIVFKLGRLTEQERQSRAILAALAAAGIPVPGAGEGVE